MLRRFSQTSPSAILALALVVVALTACAPKSPEEQVAEARSKYKVTLNAFVPQEPEVPEADEVTDEVSGDETTGEETASEESAAAAAVADDETGEETGEETGTEGGEPTADSEGEVDTSREIFFDVIVQFDGTDSLQGITVEVTHADPFEKEKGSFLQYLETGTMVKSETKQVSFTHTVPDFEDGDLFSIELRSQVPPEERSEYREFAEAGSGGE